MGKKLVINTADFSDIAVSMRDIVADKTYDNTALHSGTITGYSDSRTGEIKTTQSGYVHKIIDVQYYSKIVINGTYPLHIGAFYSSLTSIETSTFVSCNGELTLTDGMHEITNKTVTIPSGVKALSLNLAISYSDHSLQLKK